MKKINNIKNMRRKNINLLTAAALTAALLGGQAYPAYSAFAGSSSVSSESISVFPENVTIEAPTELYNISLPGSEYGTLSWADGSYMPSKRVQSCEVVLTPAGSADLSGLKGYDQESGVVTGYVTVVVSSIEEEPGDEPENSEDSGDTGENPDGTPAPDGSATPDGTVTPAVTGTPEGTVTPEGTITPGGTVTPEGTITPEGTVAPEGTVTPGAEDDSDTDAEDKDQGDKTQESSEPKPGEDSETEENKNPADTAPAEQIGAAGDTEGSVSEAENQPTDIFEMSIEQLEDTRPTTVEESLTEEEKAARAEENHRCAGISVSGVNLPWYVQFRARSGDEYQFTNKEEAAIFQSYEFELWDLQNNTEYIIPDGEYISVTVPVKEGYEYIIEHLLDNGATETIVPSVEGNTMVFSTHSFSPFGIAGSKPIVGSDIAENSYPDSQEQLGAAGGTAAQQSSVTATPAGSSGKSNLTSAADSGDGQDQSDDSSSSKAVNTGDTTNIYPFVILLAVAVIFVGVVIYLKKRK